MARILGTNGEFNKRLSQEMLIRSADAARKRGTVAPKLGLPRLNLKEKYALVNPKNVPKSWNPAHFRRSEL